MAYVTADAGSKIINTASGIVASAVDIEGGYFPIDSLSNIPDHAKVLGALCYCTGDTKFYQFNGTNWVEKEFGTKVEASDTNGKIKLDGADTIVYTHASHTAKNHGLYKITVDSEGHVSDATAVTKEDITDLGIPGQDKDTTYDLDASKNSTNGNVKLNLTAGGSGSGTDSVTIKGSGATTVTTDANGVIIVSSTDNNDNDNTAHTHEAGTGLALDTSSTGYGAGGIDGKVKYKAKLKTETALTLDATAATTTSGRVYPVAVDKSGYLAVNVPWTDTNTQDGNDNQKIKVDVPNGTDIEFGANDTVEFVAGDNISIEGNKENKTITISGAYNNASTNSPGLMSKEDKINLDTLTDLLKNDDANTTVNTIREVLDVFANYPEQTTIVNVLAGKATAEHTHTVSHTPAGTVSQPTFTGTEAGHTHPFSGSASHKHTFTGTGVVIKGTFTGTEQTASVDYTPAGTVSTPTITVTPNTTTVNSITDVGSLPTLTHSDVNTSKITDWSAGSVPSLTYDKEDASNITAWNAGSAPSLTYSEVTASKISAWDAGKAPSLTFNQGSLPSASLSGGSASLTGEVSVGPNRTVTLTLSHSNPTLTFSAGTLPTATWDAGSVPSLTYTDVDADDITAWSAGSTPSLSYTAAEPSRITAWNAGTAPSLTYEAVAASKIDSWSAGTLPTKGEDITVVTGIASATSTQPTFTGTPATISHTHTPSGSVAITTAAPTSGETANYTPAGTLDDQTVTISGTTDETKITPAGTVSQPTFTGTNAELTTSEPNS